MLTAQVQGSALLAVSPWMTGHAGTLPTGGRSPSPTPAPSELPPRGLVCPQPSHWPGAGTFGCVASEAAVTPQQPSCGDLCVSVYFREIIPSYNIDSLGATEVHSKGLLLEG